MRFAVTGSTGMIGSELTEMLLEKGHEVIVIVNPDSKRLSNLPSSPRLKIIKCSVSDLKTIENSEKCDIFFHLAWVSSGVNERDDVYTQVDNIRFSLDAVGLAQSWGAKTFVGAGSQAEYGRVTETITPYTPARPESGYGAAKSATERLARLMCGKLGMRFCWTRIVSVFGKHDADHTLIMYLVKTLLAGDVPSLTECEQTWDYLYVKDCVEALIAIALNGDSDKVYPIASGHSRQLADYVRDVRDAIDPALELGFGKKEYFPHQPMKLSVDISELTEDTGFVPRYSFRDGIREVIEYVREHSE